MKFELRLALLVFGDVDQHALQAQRLAGRIVHHAGFVEEPARRTVTRQQAIFAAQRLARFVAAGEGRVHPRLVVRVDAVEHTVRVRQPFFRGKPQTLNLRADVEQVARHVQRGGEGDRRNLFDQAAVFGFGGAQLFFRCVFVGVRLALAQHALDHRRQQFEVIARAVLDQVVARAAAHGVDGNRDVLGTGQQHHRHRQLAAVSGEFGEKLHAVHVRQVVVEQNQIRRRRVRTLQPGARRVGFLHLEYVAGLRRQRAAAGEPIDGVVLD